MMLSLRQLRLPMLRQIILWQLGAIVPWQMVVLLAKVLVWSNPGLIPELLAKVLVWSLSLAWYSCLGSFKREFLCVARAHNPGMVDLYFGQFKVEPST
jgi:hypothetical protein